MLSYYLHRDGENHGPYPEARMRQMVASGMIAGGEMVCVEGGGKWVAASSLFSTPAAPGPMARVAMTPKATAGMSAKLVDQPPRIGLVVGWLWLYAITFTIGAVWVLYTFANLTHQVTGEKNGLAGGVLLFVLIESFAVAFALIARGLVKRMAWAHRLACRFMFVNIFSPLFFLALIGLKRLGEEGTISSFEGGQDSSRP